MHSVIYAFDVQIEFGLGCKIHRERQGERKSDRAIIKHKTETKTKYTTFMALKM